MPPSWKAVFSVVERGGRKHWLRIGIAFVNRDGSLNVRLDAIPLTGQLQIRDPPGRNESADPLPEPADAMPKTAGPAASVDRSAPREPAGLRAPVKRGARRQP